ncbi:MAG: glutamyl-tRNA reductase [Prevotella sp.]|nr:glutamyl-tRNA reductase [Prevotella sp.]
MISYRSINQKNTSLATRENLFYSAAMSIDAPSVFLQTCNRMEVYYGNGDVPVAVARHLFRVVSGLESALIGERAVQGQVKEAYMSAKAKHKLPAEMNKLFEFALQVGKRVRTETEISHGAVSHSLAAIETIEDEQIDLNNAHITIIGVNKLTADILKFLKNKGAKTVFLANRSQEKAHQLADPLGIPVVSLSEKDVLLKNTDILISATSAPHTIINAEDVKGDKKLLAIDLAFPRDIDAALGNRKGVTLYNIRDVEQKVQKNISIRTREVTKAEQIIEEEIDGLNEVLERRKHYLQHA